MLRSNHPIDLWELLAFVLIVMAFYGILRRYIIPVPQHPTYILCSTPVFGADPMDDSVPVPIFQLYAISPYVSAKAPVMPVAPLELGAAASSEAKKTL